MRDMCPIPENQLQRVRSWSELDCRFGLSFSKMMVALVIRNGAGHICKTRVNYQVMVARIFPDFARRSDGNTADAEFDIQRGIYDFAIFRANNEYGCARR